MLLMLIAMESFRDTGNTAQFTYVQYMYKGFQNNNKSYNL